MFINRSYQAKKHFPGNMSSSFLSHCSFPYKLQWYITISNQQYFSDILFQEHILAIIYSSAPWAGNNNADTKAVVCLFPLIHDFTLQY